MNALVLDKFSHNFDENLLCSVVGGITQASGGDTLVKSLSDVNVADEVKKAGTVNQSDVIPEAGKKGDTTGGNLVLSEPKAELNKANLGKLADLFSGAAFDTVMSLMAEISKYMAEQKRENRSMRDVNTQMAVNEKMTQAKTIEDKASDILKSALIRGIASSVMGVVQIGVSIHTLKGTMKTLKEATKVEKQVTESFNESFKNLSGFKDVTAAQKGIEKQLAAGGKVTEEISKKAADDVQKMVSKASDVANKSVSQSADSIYKQLDVFQRQDGLAGAISTSINTGMNTIVGGVIDSEMTKKDAAVKKSEALEQEFQAFADNLRQLIDSNKELVDTANRTMQSISDSRVQTMNKILG